MFKRTHTIRRQQPTNCLSMLDHFVGLAFKGLIYCLSYLGFDSNFEKYKHASLVLFRQTVAGSNS